MCISDDGSVYVGFECRKCDYPAKPFPPPKIRRPVRSKAADAVNAALLQHRHLGPRTHQAIREQHVAGPKQIPEAAEKPQLTLALAGVPADAHVEDRPAGE